MRSDALMEGEDQFLFFKFKFFFFLKQNKVNFFLFLVFKFLRSKVVGKIPKLGNGIMEDKKDMK